LPAAVERLLSEDRWLKRVVHCEKKWGIKDLFVLTFAKKHFVDFPLVAPTRSTRCPWGTSVIKLVFFTAVFVGCNSGSPSPDKAVEKDAPEGTPGEVKPDLMEGLDLDVFENAPVQSNQDGIEFVDVAQSRDLIFRYDNGSSPEKLMPVATSGGCGWIDYDHDGWQDLFLPQGGELPCPASGPELKDQLFRNIRGARFVPLTSEAGVNDYGYGHGIATGDFDNDGFADVYVSNVGRNLLLRNLGDGTFEDVTASSGISNQRWAASAGFGDLDNDGDLEIYVCNYVDYDPERPIACLDEQGKPTTCHPNNVDGVPNCCYWNNGDLTFTESADKAGLNGPGSKSLGVVIADLDRDRDMDVYVANDTEANHLFINDGSGVFTESAVGRGCAANGLGQFQASMGVALGDYDRDGNQDLYVTHFMDDSNTLYRNLGGGIFSDDTRTVGLHEPTLDFLGFGTVMVDFDADGWNELFVTNGHIDDWRERTGAPWKMRGQLFRFGGTLWQEISDRSGPYFQKEWLGRGCAVSDFDRDGDIDIVVNHQNDELSLLENHGRLGHWVQLRVVGSLSNRDGTGSEIIVQSAGVAFVHQTVGGTGYCSANAHEVYVGLGDSKSPVSIMIHWPSGNSTSCNNVAVDQSYVISEKNGLLSDD
jgi:hypothetical protein